MGIRRKASPDSLDSEPAKRYRPLPAVVLARARECAASASAQPAHEDELDLSLRRAYAREGWMTPGQLARARRAVLNRAAERMRPPITDDALPNDAVHSDALSQRPHVPLVFEIVLERPDGSQSGLIPARLQERVRSLVARAWQEASAYLIGLVHLGFDEGAYRRASASARLAHCGYGSSNLAEWVVRSSRAERHLCSRELMVAR
jgi:hypothetical protein